MDSEFGSDAVDVLLLKLLLIKYITIQMAGLPAAYSPLERNTDETPTEKPAISVTRDDVTEQDRIFHISSMLVNDHVLLQD